MSGRNVYNVTAEQEKIMHWRDAKRKKLREMYLRDSSHPTKSLLCDTGIYRFSSANATVMKYFIPSVTKFMVYIGLSVTLVASTYIGLEKTRGKKEHSIRTGQVSYADRIDKFV
ncbi:uncharacterized protein LOC105185453 [Harpegnathos saltator]|uniref:uncharacterized protein LOC105185453 n=1 Tax=Harpegnathos saltator TaxID=610380 RepID=UPI00058EF43C|nr:uncharacterized protein LOC105185453 [Harpegnathos saltator]